MAKQSLPEYFRKPYQDLSGGKCTRPDPQTVPANKFVQLDNAILADHDYLEKAPGYTLDGSPFPATADSFIRMMVNYRVGTSVNSIVVSALDAGNTNATYKVDFKQTFGDGTYNYIGYTAGTATFTNASANVSGSGTAWLTNLKAGDKIKPNNRSNWFEVQSVTNDTALVLTTTYSDATSSAAAYMARIILSLNFSPVGLVFNNKLVITNGSEKMMEFDNTSMLRITDTDAPLALFLEKHKGRVFAATASTLYWSKVNDETTWDAASLAPVFPQDNGNIVQIKSFANSLMVFKDNGLIYQVMGEFDQDVIGAPTQIKLMDVPDNLGIIAGKTVCKNDDNQLYFMCETGVYTLDPWYLQFKKISWDIQPDIANLIFKSSPTSNKQFTFATQTQWNTGTHAGTVANGSNQLTLYCDRLAFIASSGSILNNGIACAIDSSSNVHAIAYSGNFPSLPFLLYTQFKADGTSIQENPFQISTPVSVGCAVASNGHVGASWVVLAKNLGAGTATARLFYTERVVSVTETFVTGSNSVTGSGTSWSTQLTAGSVIKNAVDSSFATVQTVNSDTSITLTAVFSGTPGTAVSYVAWSNPAIINTITNSSGATNWNGAISMRFNSTNVRILYVNGGRAQYLKSSTGTFSTVSIVSSLSDSLIYRASLYVSGSNASASFTLDNSTIRCWTSSSDGATWTSLENFGASLTSQDGIQVARDGGGNSITGYGDGAIKKRNHSTATTTTLDSTANSEFNGYIFYSGNDYAMNIAGTIAFGYYERYTFLSNQSVSDSIANRLNKGKYPAQGGMDNNGAVFASVAFGTNTNEVVLRRVSFSGTWTSAVTTDATLSSWGTYVVSGENDHGATVLQQIALGTTSSVGAPTTITSGQVVSTDPTKIFFQITVTMTLSQLVAPVIGSIVLNYLGAGIDAKSPFSFIFNNEMYMACCRNGSSANDIIQFLDRRDAWGDTTIGASCLARMLQTLYAGSSTNGNVYKLKQGLTFNGAAYSLTAITKEDMLGSLELQKEVSKAYLLYRTQASGTFTFSYRLDSYKTPGGSAWTDIVVDQTVGGTLVPFEVPIRKTCSSIQFKISQNDAGVQIAFIGFVFLYGNLELR